jgi:hypothetical protein
MKPFPVQSWQQLNKQSPIFRQRFDSYQEYGKTTIDQLLTPEEKDGALTINADYLQSSYIENLGDGNFSIKPLPLMAQVAPVNGINTGDFNRDGNLDVMLIGNDYGNEVNMGQYDAMTGLVLFGDGKGDFTTVSERESGFLVDGDAKGLARLIASDGSTVFLATQNRGELMAYTAEMDAGRTLAVNPDDFRAIYTYADGSVRVEDIQYGAGFLSQSTRKLSIPEGVSRVQLVNYKGEIREVEEVQ